jgi:hypothetical protein
MTSAPKSANNMVQAGPAICWLKSTILIPSGADLFVMEISLGDFLVQ